MADEEAGPAEAEPQEFIECLRWDGLKEGYYFGTTSEGLGYHVDRHVAVTKPAVQAPAKSVVETTDSFEAVKAAGSPAGAAVVVSKKEAKRVMKMSPAQRLLAGYADATFEPSPDGNGMIVRRPAKQEPDVAAKKVNAASKPEAAYSYQKANPTFKNANTQKRAISKLYYDEQAKKQRTERREAERETMYLRQNKPSWV
ncbi:hypothetical protein DIPPA_30832 [Diplonema papillatum]|nr:hypothetical protein DIPPA_30832 [Diplonema papillatum]